MKLSLQTEHKFHEVVFKLEALGYKFVCWSPLRFGQNMFWNDLFFIFYLEHEWLLQC